MTQEDKELLLKDLCARLPYKVKVCLYKKEACILMGIDGNEVYLDVDSDSFYVENIKPYLRPMSSMTEDERKYIEDKCAFTTIGPIGGNFSLVMPVIAAEWLIDFYNSHHLDWRGLIRMGLALEAPEGMYDIK